jgi:hypothetical protein
MYAYAGYMYVYILCVGICMCTYYVYMHYGAERRTHENLDICTNACMNVYKVYVLYFTVCRAKQTALAAIWLGL